MEKMVTIAIEAAQRAVNDAILKAYHELCERLGRTPEVAVRSSATEEDIPDASFAGQRAWRCSACAMTWGHFLRERSVQHQMRELPCPPRSTP